MKESLLRRIIDWQIKLSLTFDRILPEIYRIDGCGSFKEVFVPKHMSANMKVYDVGGGKHPFFDLEQKKEYNLNVTGIDIDSRELEAAEKGLYDGSVCTDICEHHGKGDGDLVVCQALLEHVKNTRKAFQSIGSILKTGGVALIFVPSSNALYAIINRLIPNELKKKILFFFFPGTEKIKGFKAYYDHCTPSEFIAYAKEQNLTLIDGAYFFKSSYFSVFFPLYVFWRFWPILFRAIKGNQAAETFALAFRKG